MDFSTSADQANLREGIVRFGRKELNENVVQRDRDHTFSRELWKKCGAMGIQGLPFPEEYGGSGLDALSTMMGLEALGYGCQDSGLVFSLSAQLFSCMVPIWKFGSEEQKRCFLPGLVDGTLIGSHGMTEPDSGSDAFAMRTIAAADDHGFRLNGTKTFVSNGPVADLVLVFAMTDREKGYLGGATAFLVEKGTPGLRIGQKFEKMGLRTSPMSELVFEDVHVGSDAVLGGVGGAATIFRNGMDWERVGIFACHVGTMQRLLETAIQYAQERVQYGQRIGKFQAVSHRIADMKVQLEAARLLVYRAAWHLDHEKNPSLDASIAKLFVSESLVKTALETIQILGGYGYIVDYEVERALRDAVASTLYSGTSEIQRNMIARWLGL
jgi:alkylation response protein AidB-like acyl-CoA dehydrogenase